MSDASTQSTLEVPESGWAADHDPDCRRRLADVDTAALQIIHDLRNPLSAIRAAAEMIIEAELSTVQIERLARNMYQASMRSQELLQNFLESCRLDYYRRRRCNLGELIAAAVTRVSASAGSQLVRIQQFVRSDLVITADRPGMESVLDNLLNNAVEALPGGGLIQVSASHKAGWALIEVRDTGPGIAPCILPRLFQPFVSAGKKNGLGLGLAASYQTVMQHGGRMWHSTEPGWGACFRFSLPMETVSARCRTAIPNLTSGPAQPMPHPARGREAFQSQPAGGTRLPEINLSLGPKPQSV